MEYNINWPHPSYRETHRHTKQTTPLPPLYWNNRIYLEENWRRPTSMNYAHKPHWTKGNTTLRVLSVHPPKANIAFVKLLSNTKDFGGRGSRSKPEGLNPSKGGSAYFNQYTVNTATSTSITSEDPFANTYRSHPSAPVDFWQVTPAYLRALSSVVSN